MNKEKVNQIKERVKAKTGINLEDYHNEELSEKISEIVVFPLYAAKIIFIPLLILVLITAFLIILAFVKGKIFIAVVMLIIGIPLSIADGLLLGIHRFVMKTIEDVKSIILLSLQTSDDVLTDVGKLEEQTSQKVEQLPSASEIVNGVLYHVVLPNVMQLIVQRKLPLIGTILTSVFTKIVHSASARMTKILAKTKKPEKVYKEKIGSKWQQEIEAKKQMIDGLRTKTEDISSGVIGFVDIPFRIALFILIPVSFILASIALLLIF